MVYPFHGIESVWGVLRMAIPLDKGDDGFSRLGISGRT